MNTALVATDKIRVLLVEDEFLIAEWVAESLSEQGFLVQVARDANEALRHLASDQIDVLFTDINLPGAMDGVALARRARESWPRLPVIYASARIAAPETDARVPGAMFLRKPYEPELAGQLIAGAVRTATAARHGVMAGYGSSPPRARNSSSQWM